MGEAETITCAQIQPFATPITTGFAFSAPDSSEDATGTACVWVSDAVDSSSTDLNEYAAIGITIDRTGWSADELASAPGATDDPRAAALGGRILLLTPGATLGEAGSVQLLLPHSTITVVATGALLTDPQAAVISTDTVIDVAIGIARLHE